MSSTRTPQVPEVKARLPALAPGPDLNNGALRNRRGIGRRTLMAGCMLLLCATLGIGFWRHYTLRAQVMATAEQPRELILEVRTALVHANPSIILVRLPAITQAFAQANIYARASGYISRREVDIGSNIKMGQLLVAACRLRCNRQRPTVISPRTPGTATTASCNKASSRSNRATSIASILRRNRRPSRSLRRTFKRRPRSCRC